MVSIPFSSLLRLLWFQERYDLWRFQRKGCFRICVKGYSTFSFEGTKCTYFKMTVKHKYIYQFIELMDSQIPTKETDIWGSLKCLYD